MFVRILGIILPVFSVVALGWLYAARVKPDFSLTGIAIAGLLALVLDLDSTQQGLLFIFGSLPPAVLNFMVAEQYRQEPSKVASIVLIGNMMAVLFVPVGLSLALR